MVLFGFILKVRYNCGVVLCLMYWFDGWVMGFVDKEGWGLLYVFV